MGMGMKIKFVGVFVLLLLVMLPSIAFADKPARMLITEVKTGGVIAGKPTEFVEIYNDSVQNINLEGWTIEYAKPSAKISDCQVQSWSAQDSSANVKEYLLSGEITAGQKLIIEISMNDNIGGSLRLNNNSVVFDLVGWGNTVSQAVCSEEKLAPMPVSAKSIRRLLSNGEVIDTNNNSFDFTDTESNIVDSLPNIAQEPLVDVCNNFDGIQNFVPPSYTSEDGQCTQTVNQPLSEKCHGVVLSEILPNPAGVDTGNEYIELYNTTGKEVNLAECSIKIGSSVKKLSGVIAPGYQAIYGFVLPNTSGGAVELITGATEEVVNYPIDLKDDQAWALINGQWQLTEQPTPGAENIAYLTVEEVNTTSVSSGSLEPCPEGKYRNPETNRCKTIEVEEGLKPCDPGQMRNPETNRCKKTAEVLTSIKPCDPGQERNPATNRCRKVSAKVALASCKEGQERNPDTNRCRKVASTSTSSPTSSQLEQDVKQKQNISYGIFGAMAVLVFGYGIYEYRANIANFFTRLKK